MIGASGRGGVRRRRPARRSRWRDRIPPSRRVPGQVLKLYVGGKGGSTTGGWNGGGSGPWSELGGGGGGGASDVRVRAVPTLSNRIVVGGGGGGAGRASNTPIPHLPGGGGNGGGADVAGSQGTTVSGGLDGAGGGWGGSIAEGFAAGVTARTPSLRDLAYAGSDRRAGAALAARPVRVERDRAPRPEVSAAAAVAAGTAAAVAAAAPPAAPVAAAAAATGPPGSTSTPPGALGAHGKITISYRRPGHRLGRPGRRRQLTSAPTAVLRPGRPEPPDPGRVLPRHQQPGHPTRGHRRRPRPRAQPRRRALPRLHRRRRLARRRNPPRPLRPRHRERPVAEDLHLDPGLGTLDRPHHPRHPHLQPHRRLASTAYHGKRQLDVFFRGTRQPAQRLTTTNGTWARPPWSPAWAPCRTAPSAASPTPRSGGSTSTPAATATPVQVDLRQPRHRRHLGHHRLQRRRPPRRRLLEPRPGPGHRPRPQRPPDPLAEPRQRLEPDRPRHPTIRRRRHPSRMAPMPAANTILYARGAQAPSPPGPSPLSIRTWTLTARAAQRLRQTRAVPPVPDVAVGGTRHGRAIRILTCSHETPPHEITHPPSTRGHRRSRSAAGLALATLAPALAAGVALGVGVATAPAAHAAPAGCTTAGL